MPRRRQPEQIAATTAAIKDTARALMDAHGTAGLSLRAIARQLDMTAPALYHYFASLDDLITALILDAFNGLAEAVEDAREQHADAAPYTQLFESLRAYRAWALDHKTEFLLIFGSPIPGYEAPRELTVPAATRSQIALGMALRRVLESGAHVPPHYTHIPPQIDQQLRAILDYLEGAEDYPTLGINLTLGLWTDLQGLVLMELLEQLPPTVQHGDDWFHLEMERRLQDRGLKP